MVCTGLSAVSSVVEGGAMSVAGGCLIREAEPGLDDDAVAALMVDYLTWAIERLASEYGVDEPPTHPSLVRDGLPNYRPPFGKLLLAECDGRPVGVGAIRRLRSGIAEVKRMYVEPGWRDRHVGSAILDRLLDEAREMGAPTVLLDTCRFMTEAHRLTAHAASWSVRRTKALKSLRDFNICGSFSSGARLSAGSPASPRRPGMWPGSP